MKKNYLLFLVILLFISCKTELIHQKYTVTFDSDGGTAVSSQEIEEGNFAQKPDTPIKEDYDFIDWYIGETLFDFFTPITSDITLKAKWDKKTFTVIFDSDGGSEVTSQVIEIKSTVTKPEDPTKDECDFLGWYISDSLFDFSTPITSNITLKAKWEKQKESTSVTLDSNDENKNPSQEIENGSTDIPSEEQKQFYTVTFDSNDGSGVLSQKIESGKTVSRPEDPYRERYNFIGWFLGDNKFDFSTPITSKIILKAKWEQITFTVTFDFNGAKDNIEKEVEKGKLVTNESASWTSHKFQGWFYEDTLFDFSTPINNDLTLKAKWIKTCTVRFVYNDPANNIVLRHADEGEFITDVPMPDEYWRTGYSFAGWYLAEQKINFENTVITDDMEVKGKWYCDSVKNKLRMENGWGLEKNTNRYTIFQAPIYYVVPCLSDGSPQNTMRSLSGSWALNERWLENNKYANDYFEIKKSGLTYRGYLKLHRIDDELYVEKNKEKKSSSYYNDNFSLLKVEHHGTENNKWGNEVDVIYIYAYLDY